MNPILRNILAVVAGIIVGNVVNMGIVIFSGEVVSLPEGVTLENVLDNIHLFQPKHFVMPWLAHAVGTFAGAFVAAKLAATHKMKFALGIGAWFLFSGSLNLYLMKGTPLWFTIVDLVGAYLPMGWLGGTLGARGEKDKF